MNKTGRAAGWLMVAAAVAGLALAPVASANNMVVTNVVVANQNPAARTLDVTFDLRWDNSWRCPCDNPAYTNWDAAWVFVKFQAPNSNKWEHALLSANSADDAVSGGGTLAVATNGANGVGVFVYSATPNTGAVNYVATRLRWNYGANGYAFAAGSTVTVSVKAIEMVYVPQGAFYVGDGTNDDGQLYAGGGGTNPFLVAAEAAIPVSNQVGCLWGVNQSGSTNMGGNGWLPAAFPKGYNAFYCMKYDVSQGQYCDFLNSLSAGQAANRYTYTAGAHYSIATNVMGVYTSSAPDRACGYVSWPDTLAYAAWAGLRPMTELEFEKACRGPLAPVSGEFAWGTTVSTNVTGFVGVDGSGTETANPATANCVIAGGPGYPVRVGIFATATSGRQSAGASYWGIMELSGNLWKRCVTIGSVSGRNFAGTLGSGVLDANGNASITDWYADGTGAGFRGGDWFDARAIARVSDRWHATVTDVGRGSAYGLRAVRTSP